jgi:hypothetical protein
MFTFDPWELLGLKTTSTVNDVRKAYYSLAKIVHPDRGGNAEDMRNVYNAYKWIENQLSGATTPIVVEDPTKTPIVDHILGEKIDESYERLKTTDDARTRIMVLEWVRYIIERDLMIENELKNIDEYIQESIDQIANAKDSMLYASVPDGYGSMMDPRQDITDYTYMEKEETKPSIGFTKELAVYTEPICINSFDMVDNDLAIPKRREDYSGNKEKLCMTDYMVAFSPNVISNKEQYDKEMLEKTINALKDCNI